MSENTKIIDNKLMGSCYVDLNGTIIDCNADFHNMLGFTKEKLINTNYFDLIKPEGNFIFDQLKIQLIEGNKDTYSHKVRLVNNNNDTIAVDILFTIFNKNTDTAFYIIKTEELDQIAQRRLEQIESDITYLDIFDTIALPACFIKVLVDENNEIYDVVFVDTNKVFIDIFGIKRTEIIGRTMTEVFPYLKKFIYYVLIPCYESAKTGEIKSVDFFSQITQKWFRASFSSPQKHYVTAVLQDITIFKSSEDALKNMQAQQRAILDSIPDIAWLKDHNSNFIAINEAFCKACDARPGEIIGKTDFDYFPEELAERYRKDDEKVKKTKESIIVEEPFIGKNGKSIFIETIKTPIFNYNNEVVGTTGIARDVTERHKMEIALKESEIRFRELFNNMSSGVAVYKVKDDGTDFFFRDFNKAAENINKIKREDIIGKSLLGIYPKLQNSEFYRLLRKVWQTGEPEYLPPIYTKMNKIEGWFDNHIYKLPSGELVTVFNDVTQRIDSEQIKENYIATLSHDLKVPLLAENQALRYFIKGSYGTLSEKQMVAARNMLNSNNHLLNLVKTLVDVYKYEHQQLEMQKRQVNMLAVINDCIAELSSLIEFNKKIIECKVSDDLPLIYADEPQIKRVLINLISNAIDNTDENGIIIINNTSKNGKLIFEITDNGNGIPENEIGKIFDRYYTNAKKFRKVGTGLGLYLSKQIITAHNGEIWVKSAPEIGSKFYFSLPIE